MNNRILNRRAFRKGSWLLAILVISGLLVGGCGSAYRHQTATSLTAENPQQEHTSAVTPEQAIPLPKLDYRAYMYYVNGLMYEQFGDMYNAARSYQLALERFPTSQEIGFSYARALYRLGRRQDAISQLGKLPFQDVESLRLTARCYADLNQPDSVRTTYLKVIQLDPDNSLAYSFLAGLYRQRGDIDSTIWAYSNLARVRPENYRHLNELGRLLAKNGDYIRAREAFRESMKRELSATNMTALLSLSELYMMDDQLDSARTVLMQGMRISPTNKVLLGQLTSLFVRKDSLSLALPYAIKLAAIAPEDRSVQRRLGILYFSTDSLAQADSVFSSLVQSGDRSGLNYYYLGRIAALDENWYRARDEFTQLTQVSDTVAESWLDLGLAYRRLNRSDQEIDTYLTGLNHMRNERSAVSLYFALGAAYERTDQIDKAVETFEEIIAHNPDHAQSLNYLGYMLADRGERLEYAKDLIQRAVELNPKNAAYLDSYGWVSYRLGKYQEALKHLSEAAKLDSDPVIFDHLGDTYNALGRVDLARQWWEKALQQQPDNETIKAKLQHQ